MNFYNKNDLNSDLSLVAQKAHLELVRLKEEMDRISLKIMRRARELDSDVISIRNDPTISDLWRNLCSYHRKAMLMCAGMRDDKSRLCVDIEKPQACVEALHLSEEEICCEVFKRRLSGGGRLVKFLMSSPVITVNQNSSAEVAIKLMKKHGVGSVVVVKRNRIMGIVTESDLASKVYAQLRDPKYVSIQEIMTWKRLITISPEADIKDALKLMNLFNVKHLPVVEDGKLLGMIAVPDFYRE